MTNMSEGEKLRTEHRDICGQLNIDAATEEQSWNSFQDTQKTYNLDVDQLHWLCCSLFITCRKKVTPTVGNTNSVLHGNCVSMTRLLRLCKINLNEFFKKINQWMEMTSQPEDCRNAISSLQHNFIVTMSIYQKYRDMFPSMFVAPCEEEQRRGKKSKPQPCTSGQLYKFCWKLFICAKSEYPDQNGDLVKSYNMLLCCLDLVYANVIAEGRTDLVNPAFEGLPKYFISQGVIPPEPVCIIEHIKEDNCSSVIMDMRETIWKSTIQQFCQTNVLRGNSETLMELITVANFEFNLKSLDTTYNTFILSYGEFDESIALEQKTPEGPLLVKSELPLSGTPERIPLYQQTPLNGRTRHVSNDVIKFTPISTANASVAKLHMKLMISNAGEGHGSFKELLRMCPQDLSHVLRERVAAMREKFVRYMHDQKWSRQAIASRWEKIQTLYYRLLEFIIRAEVKRTKVNMVKELCCEDMFNQTLLVCSAEIVTFAHNLQQNFPCILKVFDMPPFIFYRIIELVMMHHNDLLSREITKHLDIIENQCIESLCWQSNSPLWRAMENIGYRVPCAKDVECSIDLSGITPHKPGDSASKINGQLQFESTPSTSTSTPSTSASGSARKPPNPDSAKKRLFMLDGGDESGKSDASQGKDSTSETSECPPEKKETPKESTAPISFMSPFKAPIPNGSVSKRKPGNASLNLFFRKYYATAALRLKHLCAHLNLSSRAMVEIWTIFEHSVVNSSKELIRDRHLDQMVMCSIYLYARIKRDTRTFADVMKAYRTLPQSYSHVYRSVFISRKSVDQQQSQQNGTNSNTEGGAESRRVQPGDIAGVSVQHGDEERGDIIRFYNTVYITEMQSVATQFGNEEGRSLMLSPLPKTTNRCLLQSPKKVDNRISLYLTPMDKSNELKESPNAITIQFCHSPAKFQDLQKINQIVKNAPQNSCKRSLSDPDSYEQPTMKQAPRKCRKLDRLVSDRQQQESNVNPK